MKTDYKKGDIVLIEDHYDILFEIDEIKDIKFIINATGHLGSDNVTNYTGNCQFMSHDKIEINKDNQHNYNYGDVILGLVNELRDKENANWAPITIINKAYYVKSTKPVSYKHLEFAINCSTFIQPTESAIATAKLTYREKSSLEAKARLAEMQAETERETLVASNRATEIAIARASTSALASASASASASTSTFNIGDRIEAYQSDGVWAPATIMGIDENTNYFVKMTVNNSSENKRIPEKYLTAEYIKYLSSNLLRSFGQISALPIQRQQYNIYDKVKIIVGTNWIEGYIYKINNYCVRINNNIYFKNIDEIVGTSGHYNINETVNIGRKNGTIECINYYVLITGKLNKEIYQYNIQTNINSNRFKIVQFADYQIKLVKANIQTPPETIILSDPNEICAICLEPLKSEEPLNNNNSVVQLKCKHLFHNACIQKWCKNKKKCPLCNKTYNNCNFDIVNVGGKKIKNKTKKLIKKNDKQIKLKTNNFTKYVKQGYRLGVSGL